ncbi:hypothetical protein Emin_0827 [Elusimicrobium minutum Pei191]|uniref:Uncharacterized protein n=1 Tax=Elusimicrobium minutum (strain Pei191) TaxID=445932 RepID=B2KCY6_ELUMP|nr:hypothetical protein [Elusimicrobium minutum]ACC98382.1 hypothetical protein Emin_0827 [Elusimicrobium minutum Pei191]
MKILKSAASIILSFALVTGSVTLPLQAQDSIPRDANGLPMATITDAEVKAMVQEMEKELPTEVQEILKHDHKASNYNVPATAGAFASFTGAYYARLRKRPQLIALLAENHEFAISYMSHTLEKAIAADPAFAQSAKAIQIRRQLSNIGNVDLTLKAETTTALKELAKRLENAKDISGMKVFIYDLNKASNTYPENMLKSLSQLKRDVPSLGLTQQGQDMLIKELQDIHSKAMGYTSEGQRISSGMLKPGSIELGGGTKISIIEKKHNAILNVEKELDVLLAQNKISYEKFVGSSAGSLAKEAKHIRSLKAFTKAGNILIVVGAVLAGYSIMDSFVFNAPDTNKLDDTDLESMARDPMHLFNIDSANLKNHPEILAEKNMLALMFQEIRDNSARKATVIQITKELVLLAEKENKTPVKKEQLEQNKKKDAIERLKKAKLQQKGIAQEINSQLQDSINRS